MAEAKTSPDVEAPELLHFPTHDQLQNSKSMEQIIQNAKTASDQEQKMTLLQGIRLYPKAVAWSILISTCIAMEGYDVCLLNSFCRFSVCATHVKILVS
jgi:SP family general alpha glucoside:H+ symporter-like MFS transporter